MPGHGGVGPAWPLFRLAASASAGAGRGWRAANARQPGACWPASATCLQPEPPWARRWWRRGRTRPSGRALPPPPLAVAAARLQPSRWCGPAAGRPRIGVPSPPRPSHRCAPCAGPSRPRQQPEAPLLRAAACDGSGAAPCPHSPASPSAAAAGNPPRRRAPRRFGPGPHPAGRSGARGAPPTPAAVQQRCVGRSRGCSSRTVAPAI